MIFGLMMKFWTQLAVLAAFVAARGGVVARVTVGARQHALIGGQKDAGGQWVHFSLEKKPHQAHLAREEACALAAGETLLERPWPKKTFSNSPVS